jgi:hypothetical protein
MDSDVIKHRNQDFHPGQVLEVKTLADGTKCELLLLGTCLVLLYMVYKKTLTNGENILFFENCNHL